MHNQVAGVVIWYNPIDEHIDNLNSYIDEISELYIFDNSLNNNKEKLKLLSEERREKIKYISFLENKGVSYALNYAAKLAIKREKKWLLTMDQDSKFKDKTIQNYFNYKNLNSEDVGIFAPKYIYGKNIQKFLTDQEIEEVECVITSGNLVNLKIWEDIGGFEEYFFIDEIDHEYCLRLRLNDKKICVINKVCLYHNLGELKVKKFLFKKITYTEHNSFRKYNIWRNKLYMMKKYPNLRKKYIKFFIKDLIKIILLENKKKDKFKSIVKIFYKKNKSK